MIRLPKMPSAKMAARVDHGTGPAAPASISSSWCWPSGVVAWRAGSSRKAASRGKPTASKRNGRRQLMSPSAPAMAEVITPAAAAEPPWMASQR